MDKEKIELTQDELDSMKDANMSVGFVFGIWVGVVVMILIHCIVTIIIK